MLKIYGADLSTPANKVRFCANHIGLDYEYIQVKVREGEHRSDWYLKINPIAKIPAMDDEGFTLGESGAIAKYLCEKNNSSLYPSVLEKRATVAMWSDFAAIHVNGAMGRILFNRVFFQLANVEKDERSLKDGISFLDRFLPICDKQLSQNKYLAGEDLSLADITLLSSLDPAEVTQVDLSSYDNIVKWRNDLKAQDFYTKCYKEYGEPLKQMTA